MKKVDGKYNFKERKRLEKENHPQLLGITSK